MIQQAIRSDDPVIFFEPKRRYWEKADVDTTASAADALPLDAARTVAEGTDLTLLAYGPMVKVALGAAAAAREDGRSIEVIDLRSLSPLDMNDGQRVGAPDRALRGDARGTRLRWPGRRDRRARHRGVLLLAWRHRCCASAAFPPRTRRPGSRSITCRTWTGCWTPSTAPSGTEEAAMSERKQFRLPDVGEGLTEADIVSWHVKPGDEVAVNQVIVEIETAKAVVELPCPFDGVVADAPGRRGPDRRRRHADHRRRRGRLRRRPAPAPPGRVRPAWPQRRRRYRVRR